MLHLLLNWLLSLLVSRGFSKPQSAEMQILFNPGGVAGGGLAGWLIDGRRRLVTLGSFLRTPFALLALAVGTSSLSGELAIVALVGLGLMSNQAILCNGALALPWGSARFRRGRGSGSGPARLALRPLIAGQLIGTGRGAEQVLMHMLPVLGVGTVAAAALSARPLQSMR